MYRLLLIIVIGLASTGCTWVHMAPGANAVKVVSDAPVGCENRGQVEVSVKDSLGPYERNPLRVQEELETLARNEAPGLGANTVQALAPAVEGRQRYAAWRCGH